MQNILTIKDLHLGFGNEEILKINDLKIEKNSIVGLLGPSGGGKSSLLNAIMKSNNSPSYWETGEILFNCFKINSCISKQNFSLVSQKSRLYTDSIYNNFIDGIDFKKGIKKIQIINFAASVFKSIGLWEIFKNILEEDAIKQSMGTHKLLLIAKAIVKKPKLLLLDEVIANTSVKDEKTIIKLIKELKKHTTIIFVTHNKEEAQEICDTIALISGGILHEHCKTKDFFENPKSNTAKEFIKSGSAWYSNPKSHTTNDEYLKLVRRFSSICEFYWILPNQLGGMQKPGLMTELTDDLSILQKLKVNTLICLQQTACDKSLLESYGITGVDFPFVDMGVPDIEQTYIFIVDVINNSKNDSIIYHCKAGMGRTGLMLACHLILLQNISAIKAVERIRNINYKYIQTTEQINFVTQFERYHKSTTND